MSAAVARALRRFVATESARQDGFEEVTVVVGPPGSTRKKSALQSASGTVGSIFLGRFIGVRALAALSSFFPVLFLLVSFLIGLGSGSTVLIGQAYGAGRYDRMKAVVGTTLTVTFALGTVLAVLGGLRTAHTTRWPTMSRCPL